jgi:hypothetical protein
MRSTIRAGDDDPCNTARGEVHGIGWQETVSNQDRTVRKVLQRVSVNPAECTMKPVAEVGDIIRETSRLLIRLVRKSLLPTREHPLDSCLCADQFSLHCLVQFLAEYW